MFPNVGMLILQYYIWSNIRDNGVPKLPIQRAV